MLTAEVAPGVHRVEDAYTNWYLVEDGGRLTVVDAGVPTSWDSFTSALGTLGRSTGDVQAVVLTHAHFDHIGFAERARSELGVPIRVHERDAELTRHPRAYARERRVVLVHVDGDPQLGPRPLGEADVVEVGVGEDEGADLGGVATDLPQHPLQRVPGARHPGVDDRQPGLGLDQVPVDAGVFDPVDVGGGAAFDLGLHGRPVPASSPPLSRAARRRRNCRSE